MRNGDKFKQLKNWRKKVHGSKIQSNRKVESPQLALLTCTFEIIFKLATLKFLIRSQWQIKEIVLLIY